MHKLKNPTLCRTERIDTLSMLAIVNNTHSCKFDGRYIMHDGNVIQVPANITRCATYWRVSYKKTVIDVHDRHHHGSYERALENAIHLLDMMLGKTDSYMRRNSHRDPKDSYGIKLTSYYVKGKLNYFFSIWHGLLSKNIYVGTENTWFSNYGNIRVRAERELAIMIDQWREDTKFEGLTQ